MGVNVFPSTQKNAIDILSVDLQWFRGYIWMLVNVKRGWGGGACSLVLTILSLIPCYQGINSEFLIFSFWIFVVFFRKPAVFGIFIFL
ncbi:MAG: hypothetical protein AAB276_00910, partial [Pseudomonadota bacterium]